MKQAKKWTALLAVLGLLFALWAPVAVSAEAPITTAAEPQTTELYQFGRSTLAKMNNGDALCYAYDRLIYGCETVSDHVDISHRTYRLTKDEASLVYTAVTNDHPEFFWLSDGISMQLSGNTVTAFVPYVYDGIAEERAALNARVAELTADLAGKSDYDKSLILHDRICEAVKYQYTSYDQSVIGSLVQGKSVCAGYARGYQLLLQTVGIPGFVITGVSKGQDHAWNLVLLDGEWYYTDVTWDDQNDNGGNLYYAYLNLTFDRMEEDHTAMEFAEYLPRTTATAANYHVINGTAMDLPDVETIVALYEAGVPVRLYMTGDTSDFSDALSQNMSDIIERIACPYSGYATGSSRLGREIILRLEIDQPHDYVGNACKHCGYIRQTGEVLSGDVNGDGRLNNRDLGLLQQYLNDWDVTIHTAACDMNADGRINNRDLGLLLQLLNT